MQRLGEQEIWCPSAQIQVSLFPASSEGEIQVDERNIETEFVDCDRNWLALVDSGAFTTGLPFIHLKLLLRLKIVRITPFLLLLLHFLHPFFQHYTTAQYMAARITSPPDVFPRTLRARSHLGRASAVHVSARPRGTRAAAPPPPLDMCQ